MGNVILREILVFVDISVDERQLDSVISSLKQIPNLREVYHVIGNGANIVSLVGASDIEEFREILKDKIMKIKGVKGTITSLSLAKHSPKQIAPVIS